MNVGLLFDSPADSDSGYEGSGPKKQKKKGVSYLYENVFLETSHSPVPGLQDLGLSHNRPF